MTCPSWVALHGKAYSFIELDKAMIHGSVWLVFCDCGFHSVCPLMNKDKRLLGGKKASGSFLMGRTDGGRIWVLLWWVGPYSANI